MARSIIALASVLPTVLACSAVLGFDTLSNEELVVDAAVDAGPHTDVEAGSGQDAAKSCPPLQRPARPDSATSTYDDPGTWLGLGSIGVRFEGASVAEDGLNLDGVCTEDAASSPCVSTVGPSSFADYVADAPDGVDNAVGRMIDQTAYGRNVWDLVESQTAIELTGWNLQPDDADVMVRLMPLVGRCKTDELGRCLTKDDGTLDWVGSMDAHQPTDAWVRLDPLDGVGGYSVVNRSWMVGDQLVSHLNDAQMLLQADFFGVRRLVTIRLRAVELRGRVERDTDGAPARLVKVRLSGRWADSDALGMLARMVCDTPVASELAGLSSAICAVRDLNLDPRDDDRDGKSCDALSFNIGFDTTPLSSAPRTTAHGQREHMCQTVPGELTCPTK